MDSPVFVYTLSTSPTAVPINQETNDSQVSTAKLLYLIQQLNPLLLIIHLQHNLNKLFQRQEKLILQNLLEKSTRGSQPSIWLKDFISLSLH